MQPETIHILLIIGQYVLVPFALWMFKKFKQSIITDLKAHVDLTMATHEAGESHKFQELSVRIGRIEEALIQRAVSEPKQRRAASGRFVANRVSSR